MTTTHLDRGQGLIYNGSVTSMHGQIVTAMYDCICAECDVLDLWDPERRANVTLGNGNRLIHARHSSFNRPSENRPRR